jgi:nitroimidazol reductase NimA-like FMN-containing flavoprotein (pyridoxamine 5'-phosphate oxidase superfamily)
MAEMSKKEVIRFLTQGTFTGKVATVRKERGPHVVPIWFVLDNKKRSGDQIGDRRYCIYYGRNVSQIKEYQKG